MLTWYPEGILNGDPYVNSAVMFGRGRFNPGVIIEPKSEFAFDPEDQEKLAEFRNRIWCVFLPRGPSMRGRNNMADTFFGREACLTTIPQADDRTDERIRTATFKAVQGGMLSFPSPPPRFFPGGLSLLCAMRH